MSLCDLTTIFYHYFGINVFTHFVDERKFDVQSVCDCGHPLCPSSVGTHYDCVPENGITFRLDEGVKKLKPPPAFDVLLDPLEDGRLRVQVVDGDVEEALDLARVQVHRDYVVCPRHLVSSYQFSFGFSCAWQYFVLLVGLVVRFSWILEFRLITDSMLATSLAEIGARDLSFLSCLHSAHEPIVFFLSVFVIYCAFWSLSDHLAYGKLGITAVTWK